MEVVCQIGSDNYELVEIGNVNRLVPQRIVRLDFSNFHEQTQSIFNCSIIEWEDELLLAYRTGRSGSALHISVLDDQTLQPVTSQHIHIYQACCVSGCEDPRLFVYDNQLHLGFIGVEKRGPQTWTHQLYSPLKRRGDQWIPKGVLAPQLENRHEPMEKNWVFFEWEDLLLAVYQAGWSHEIIQVRGNRAFRMCESTGPFLCDGGIVRGGASPVYHNGEHYHWFHNAKMQHDGMMHYTGGLYTFEDRPPFRVKRCCPFPLIVPDADEPKGDAKRVVFPCGAVRQSGKVDRWLVSYGYHDHECRIAVFDAAETERALIPVEAFK